MSFIFIISLLLINLINLHIFFSLNTLVISNHKVYSLFSVLVICLENGIQFNISIYNGRHLTFYFVTSINWSHLWKKIMYGTRWLLSILTISSVYIALITKNNVTCYFLIFSLSRNIKTNCLYSNVINS